MAFSSKQHADLMKSRYNAHQSAAASRTGTGKKTESLPALDRKMSHKPLPKYTAPGVNRTQTVQTDINRSTGVPKQSTQGFNKNNRVQKDLNG